jgi:hypothetical protein
LGCCCEGRDSIGTVGLFPAARFVLADANDRDELIYFMYV